MQTELQRLATVWCGEILLPTTVVR